MQVYATFELKEEATFGETRRFCCTDFFAQLHSGINFTLLLTHKDILYWKIGINKNFPENLRELGTTSLKKKLSVYPPSLTQ